jgi:hypothetical protein
MKRKTLKILGLSLLAGGSSAWVSLLVLWSIDSWKVWQQLIKKGTHDRTRTRRRLCRMLHSGFPKIGLRTVFRESFP